MNRVVYKYEIPVVGKVDIAVGANPVVRHIGAQGLNRMAWVEVDEGPADTILPLFVAGTGWPLPELNSYLGTAFVGDFVWHVYRRLP